MEEDHQTFIEILWQRQLPVIDHDKKIQVIQFENLGPQGDIRNARQKRQLRT